LDEKKEETVHARPLRVRQNHGEREGKPRSSIFLEGGRSKGIHLPFDVSSPGGEGIVNNQYWHTAKKKKEKRGSWMNFCNWKGGKSAWPGRERFKPILLSSREKGG